jgi:hypothetical protein
MKFDVGVRHVVTVRQAIQYSSTDSGGSTYSTREAQKSHWTWYGEMTTKKDNTLGYCLMRSISDPHVRS